MVILCFILMLSPEEAVCLSDGHEVMERHVSLRSRNLPSGWATSWGSVVPTFESESWSEGPASTEAGSQRPTSPDWGGILWDPHGGVFKRETFWGSLEMP